MRRAITSFSLDDDGDWFATLVCGHRQHVRHQPPFRERPWVLDAAGRAARIGTELDCSACDREPERGDPACWAGELCESCGTVRGDAHRAGCMAFAR